MVRSFTTPPRLFTILSAALLWPTFATGAAAGDGRPDAAVVPPIATVAVVDFSYLDTSGEERDQRQEHAARLDGFMAALRRDLGAQGKTVLALKCDPAPCPADELLRPAREAGAGILLIGGIHKMSTLVQWAKVAAIDTASGRAVLDKLYTFRGDSDEAWRQAESFIARDLAEIR
jgi:hypothetical protein